MVEPLTKASRITLNASKANAFMLAFNLIYQF